MLGRLQPGEQLPSVRRQGLGNFVAAAPAMPALAASPQLLNSLARWVSRARESGLSAEQIRVLVAVALDEPADDAGGTRSAEGIA